MFFCIAFFVSGLSQSLERKCVGGWWYRTPLGSVPNDLYSQCHLSLTFSYERHLPLSLCGKEIKGYRIKPCSVRTSKKKNL